MTDLYDVNPGIDGAFLYSMAQAKGESVIDRLGNNDVSKEVVKWINLIHNRTLVVQLRRLDDISLLFNKYAPRETPNPLVMSIVNIPFKTNDQFVANVSYCFEQLLVARDKQSISIPFLACGPGTGKSRTLQEIFPLTKPGQQFKDNSIILLTSFGNGFAIDPETEPLSYEKALCLRILYSYLKVNEFRAFREENKNINCTLSTVLQAIAHHFKTTNNKMNEKVYIYLGIDEFT
ncbi:hypothetical protein C9374_002796 [Naegleria lovaniensis]|uniref:Uncharacterized protein n=1 Tax=Naegleria lovaniensis TaxID=51637 RepID=A0AA88KK43_NAELO|nr:uncharacterized protein C9374_002796 [Naegleria lovaniensis]KAG2386350.1 hypothetical protein C9374_002796 [Naegleria lovaniensis]